MDRDIFVGDTSFTRLSWSRFEIGKWGFNFEEFVIKTLVNFTTVAVSLSLRRSRNQTIKIR